MEGAGECACLFKGSLCQHDKEFDGFIRNTKALFSRVRRAPLGSSQSADKLEKKKKKARKRQWGEESLNFPLLHVGMAQLSGNMELGHWNIPYLTPATLDGEARCMFGEGSAE